MARGFRLSLLLALPLAGFAVLLMILYQGLGRDPTLLPSALLHQPMPPFQAAMLENPQRTVGPADLTGTPSLLNVWATWCPTCAAEHAMLNKLADQGVVIYGVNYKDDPAKAIDWLGRLGNPYRLNIDDQAGQLGIDLGVYGAPETFVLDADGVIRYRHVGAVDEQVWQEILRPRLELLRGGAS